MDNGTRTVNQGQALWTQLSNDFGQLWRLLSVATSSHPCNLWTVRPTCLLHAPLPIWTVGVDMGELPEPWNAAAEKVGVRQTYRGIGDEAGISHVTVRRLIAEGRTSPATVSKVAKALRIDEAKVYEWAGIELSELGPWYPPAAAHQLEPRARELISELIGLLTQGGTDAGTAEAEKSATVTPLRKPIPEVQTNAARTVGPDGQHQESAD